jgi:hypothetical protein
MFFKKAFAEPEIPSKQADANRIPTSKREEERQRFMGRLLRGYADRIMDLAQSRKEFDKREPFGLLDTIP